MDTMADRDSLHVMLDACSMSNFFVFTMAAIGVKDLKLGDDVDDVDMYLAPLGNVIKQVNDDEVLMLVSSLLLLLPPSPLLSPCCC